VVLNPRVTSVELKDIALNQNLQMQILDMFVFEKSYSLVFKYLINLVVLGFEFRASQFPGRPSTA
jgi:hypothetical protein